VFGCAVATIAELADARQLRSRLGEEVDPGDPEVRHAVADEFDHVVRAHEQDVEVEVLDPRDQAPIVLFEHEPRVMEQVQGGFDQAPLVGDRQPQPLGHRWRPVG
jgi:hypothetical protein